MLAHAVRKIGCYACVELFILFNDVDEPGGHKQLGWDGLPSPARRRAQGKPFDRLKAGSQPVLPETGGRGQE